MSDSVQTHRWQPTRLCCPWDSPGKNTGVGCHFLLQCIKVEKWKVKSLSRVWLLRPHGLQPTSLLHSWDFPSKSTGVGCHCLLLKYIKQKFNRYNWSFSEIILLRIQQVFLNPPLEHAMDLYLNCIFPKFTVWSSKLYFLGLQNHCRWWLQPWN